MNILNKILNEIEMNLDLVELTLRLILFVFSFSHHCWIRP